MLSSIDTVSELLLQFVVWDVTYSAVGREVTEMEATKSNGTMAGIASMSIFPIDFFASHASLAITAASTQSTPDGYVASLSRSISQLYTYSLAAQTVPSPALLVQTRSSRVVSELPMSALWVLVVANSLYALIAIVLATLALMSASDAVHQVKTRLGTAGLAAALFAGAHSQNAADSDKSLFGETIIREHTLPKRVGLMRTDTGGSSFKTLEV